MNENICNSVKTSLSISNNPYLRWIFIKRTSLQYLNSLTISDNTQLITVQTADGTADENGSLNRIPSLTLSSMYLIILLY